MPKGPWGLARSACSEIQASGVAPPTPIMPRPPPALTAPASTPPDQLAIGAETMGCLRPNVRVNSVEIIAYLRALSGKIAGDGLLDRKSTRLNSSHANISYAVFCLK